MKSVNFSLKGRLILLSILLSKFANCQLKGNFTADITSDCSPMIVKFQDQSTGPVKSWKWDLGNGTVSYAKNPSTTYFTSGTYSIKLIVTGGGKSDTIIKSNYITVQAQPIVNFQASKVVGCFPFFVQFTDQTKLISGSISSWEWDFGDGSISKDQNPLHIYRQTGKFNVSLKVITSSGCTKTLTKQQYIQVPSGVTPSFSNSLADVCAANALINFTNNSTGPDVLDYKWHFGDNTNSTTKSPSHFYKYKGLYSVSLIVTSSMGCTDTLIKNNVIAINTFNSNFSFDTIICPGTTVDFKNETSPLPKSSVWYFDNDNPIIGTNASKHYELPGNYIARLVTNYSTCSDTITKNVVVQSKPIPNFQADNTVDCRLPLTVNFKSNSTNASEFFWDFGDGQTSVEENPLHTFLNNGNYTIKLITKSKFGCLDSIIKKDYIQISSPTITFPYLPTSGCIPLTKQFNAVINSPDIPTQYYWDFGDNATSTAINPTHTYTTEGNYTLMLKVITEKGCTSTFLLPSAIRAGTKVKANFSASPRDECASEGIDFTDLSRSISSNPIKFPDDWLWSFGDGTFSRDRSLKYFYQDTGYFSPTLVVFNNGCPDTLQLKDYIHIKSPIAIFAPTFNCNNRFTRIFNNLSIDADSYFWDFGDGQFSTDMNPTHTYDKAGLYTVKLLVSNKKSNCTHETAQNIAIINEKISFTSAQKEVCKSLLVNFNLTTDNFRNLSQYMWNFGDGNSGVSVLPDTSYLYAKSGVYNVSLIVTDILGCLDTVTNTSTIIVNSPTADFKNVLVSCGKSLVKFDDLSKDDGKHPIVTWEWIFGENNSESELFKSGPFTHTYIDTGTYSIGLKITDSNGCSDSISKIDILKISKPFALFKVDSLSCTGAPIQFTNFSTGSSTYYWDFGDHTSATVASPTHSYAKEGKYDITLQVKDQYGCEDTIIKSQFLIIGNPKALFSISDTFSNCPPLVTELKDLSKNALSYLWDFGDQNFSSIKDPTHFYSFGGDFIIKLHIISAGGCTDDYTKHIVINGPSGNFTYNTSSACLPFKTKLEANVKNSIHILWDFDDGLTEKNDLLLNEHTYTEAGDFIPKIILTDDNGCKVPIIGMDTIHVRNTTANFSIEKLIYCDSVVVKLKDNSVVDDYLSLYQWNFSDGTTSNDPSPTHSFTSSGTYSIQLNLATTNGCQSTFNEVVPVDLVLKPEINLYGSSESCIGSLIDLKAELVNPNKHPVDWLWNIGKMSFKEQKLPEIKIDKLDGYDINLITSRSNECKDTIYKSILIHPLPVVSIEGKTNVCKGDIQNLIIQGADQYSWSPAKDLSCNNCSAPSYKADQNITYVVSGTTPFGCTDKDSISIKVMQPFVMTAGGIDSICVGKSVQLSASGAVSYSWYPSTGLSNPNIASPVATPTVTTNYRVVGSNNETCFKDTSFVMVTVFPIPVVSAGGDKNINAGGTAILTPKISADVINVHWTPTLGIVGSSYPSVTVKPSQTTEYSIEAVNSGGCRSRDKMTVFVLCNDANVFIPNTFSPNGDGANDIFYPRGSGLFSIKSFRIFDRRGELVYQTNDMKANDPSKGWDGKFKGSKLAADVFIYVVEIVCDNNQILTYKGNITLLN